MTGTPFAPSDAERYGVVRVSKIRQAYNDLRKAIRDADLAHANDALDRYEQWADYVFDARHKPDLTNPGNIPFGQLPRATQEAMVIAHVLDDADVEALFSGIWFNWSPEWLDDQIYRVVQP